MFVTWASFEQNAHSPLDGSELRVALDMDVIAH